MVRSEHVRTFFDSTQSQVSYSEVGLRNGTRQCALGPIMGPLYLWFLLSNQLELNNVRDPIGYTLRTVTSSGYNLLFTIYILSAMALGFKDNQTARGN